MKKYSFALAAAMMLAGGAAFAQATLDPVVNDFVTSYSADGFTRFEVRSGLTQVKIEAYRGTEKVEVILDKTTGEVLKSETEVAGLFDDNTPGVFIRERNRDFLRSDSDDDSNDDDEDGDDSDDDSLDDDSSDDDSSDDDSSDDDSSDDDSSDDDNSDDDSSDDDSDDNSGGSDDSDDDSNDDNGGDRNGSDDSNDDNSGSGGGSDDDGDDD